MAYAARLRLTLDALDDRERRFATEGDFRRFARNCTGGLATGRSGATGGDSGCSICGSGGGMVMLRGARVAFGRPKPKASLNSAPYQSTTASAACIHGCCDRDGMTSFA